MPPGQGAAQRDLLSLEIRPSQCWVSCGLLVFVLPLSLFAHLPNVDWVQHAGLPPPEVPTARPVLRSLNPTPEASLDSGFPQLLSHLMPALQTGPSWKPGSAPDRNHQGPPVPPTPWCSPSKGHRDFLMLNPRLLGSPATLRSLATPSC